MLLSHVVSLGWDSLGFRPEEPGSCSPDCQQGAPEGHLGGYQYSRASLG